MPQIPQDIIDRVRDTSDVIDVISRYVDLKQRGANFIGLCPFHNEKTPSFSVAPSKQIYHCFGCNKGGNVFSFLMDYQKISFPEAVKFLADQYNIPISLNNETSGSEIFSALYELHQIAVKLYQENLFSKDGEKALNYLFERGIKETTIKQFKIGYARDEWDELVSFCKGKGFTRSQIIKSGLFTHSEKGIFDRFRYRIMFPIFHPSGKAIAFGARTLSAKEPAKYLNSPETMLYKKAEVFYGLNASRDEIRQKGYAVLVEGYMDFLKLYQEGIKSTIAISGTAFTKKHAIALGRIAQKVILFYDGDLAGSNAAIRAGWVLLKDGLEPSIVRPPNGLDPDNWIDSEGANEILSKIESPTSYINFHIDFNQGLKLNGIDRKNYIISLARDIKSIKDGIIRDDLVRIVSDKLMIDEKEFLRTMKTQKVVDDFNPKENTLNKKLIFTDKVEKAQIELLNLLVCNDENIRSFVKNKINLTLFTVPFFKKLAGYLIDQNLPIDSSSIIEYFQEQNERDYVARILFNQVQSNSVEKIVSDCLKILKSEPLKQKINVLRIQIREKESKGEDPMQELSAIANLRKELNGL